MSETFLEWEKKNPKQTNTAHLGFIRCGDWNVMALINKKDISK